MTPRWSTPSRDVDVPRRMEDGKEANGQSGRSVGLDASVGVAPYDEPDRMDGLVALVP